MSTALLETVSLQMRFEGLIALDDVSFSMDKGSITSLIGPNGAGKTTLFNCVTGMYRPSGGRVAFEGADITGEAAHQVSRHGIARTFQNLALFGGLSVLENLLVGAYRQGTSGLMGGAFLTPRARAEQRAEDPGVRPEPAVGVDEPNREYTVERIIQSRKRNGQTQYLTKWVGYEKPTWQDEDDMGDAQERIAEFETGIFVQFTPQLLYQL